MKLTRRQFAKANAAAVAASAVGIQMPAAASNLITNQDLTRLKWSKAPCRFCGVGCGVMVATHSDRVVATHGDVRADVNRGINCVKGYFLSKILYGPDRDRKSTRLNSSHVAISYAVFCLKKKTTETQLATDAGLTTS